LFKKLFRNSFIADVFSLSTGRIVIAAIGFLVSIFLARVLGPTQQGIVTTLLVAPAIVLSFADLGMRQAATFFLGKQIFNDQTVLSTILFMSIITSLMSAGIVAIVYWITGYSEQYALFTLWIPILSIPFRLLSNLGTGILMAKQRIREIAISNILMDLVYFLLLIPLVLINSYKVEYSLFAYFLSSVVVMFYIIRIVKNYGNLRPAYIQGVPWKFIKLGFVYGIALFVLGLHYRVDVMLLERLSSATEVGYYGIGVGVAEKIWLLPAALVTVNFARSAAASDHLAYARKTAKLLRLSLWVSVIPCMLLYFLSPRVIPLVYGDAYQRSGLIVQAILPGIWAALVFKILNSDLAGRGRPDAAMWVYGFALILNIWLNITWIPPYGAMGSAWATSVSYGVGAIIFGIVYARMSHLNIRELIIPQKHDFDLILLKIQKDTK